MFKKPLNRSTNHRILAGVCGGIADYFGWDPTLFRLAFVVISIISAAFPGILVYIIAAVIMPPAET